MRSRRVTEDVTEAQHCAFPAGLALQNLTQRNQHWIPQTQAKELQAEESPFPADSTLSTRGGRTSYVIDVEGREAASMSPEGFLSFLQNVNLCLWGLSRSGMNLHPMGCLVGRRAARARAGGASSWARGLCVVGQVRTYTPEAPCWYSGSASVLSRFLFKIWCICFSCLEEKESMFNYFTGRTEMRLFWRGPLEKTYTINIS